MFSQTQASLIPPAFHLLTPPDSLQARERQKATDQKIFMFTFDLRLSRNGDYLLFHDITLSQRNKQEQWENNLSRSFDPYHYNLFFRIIFFKENVILPSCTPSVSLTSSRLRVQNKVWHWDLLQTCTSFSLMFDLFLKISPLFLHILIFTLPFFPYLITLPSFNPTIRMLFSPGEGMAGLQLWGYWWEWDRVSSQSHSLLQFGNLPSGGQPGQGEKSEFTKVTEV